MSAQKLTTKQRRFVEAYDGDGKAAAIKAGYKGKDNTLRAIASENLTKPAIVAAIKERESKRVRPYIASREDRQKFWTDVMQDEKQHMKDRLRAAELLGKSEADFTETVQTRDLTLEDRLRQLREKRKNREGIKK